MAPRYETTDLDIRHGYGFDNPYCELARYFPSWGKPMVRVPHGGTATVIDSYGHSRSAIHHAWGRAMGNGRWDEVWNLVAVSQCVHDFCHEFRADGIVLCVKLKLDKGEWDHARAKERLGFDPHGWLESRECKWPWAEAIRKELVSIFSGVGVTGSGDGGSGA